MPEPLLPLEGRVYHYLIDFLAEHTYQPSIRDIARQFQIRSTKTVSDLLRALEAKGYIERQASRSRGVRLLGLAPHGRTQPVPCFAQVHDSPHLFRDEHRTEFVTIDRRFLPAADIFGIRVDGDAMAARGILHGDYVMVARSTEIRDGDIVCARLGTRVVARTLVDREGTRTLVSGDPADAPIHLGDAGEVAVLGRACGLFRPYDDGGRTAPAVDQPVH